MIHQQASPLRQQVGHFSAFETFMTNLVKSFGGKPLSKDFTNPSQVGHSLVIHGLRHEIPMLLRCCTHFDTCGVYISSALSLFLLGEKRTKVCLGTKIREKDQVESVQFFCSCADKVTREIGPGHFPWRQIHWQIFQSFPYLTCNAFDFYSY